MNWRHKDEWKTAGKDFLIVVSRHSAEFSSIDNDGPNRWAVYVYIYPKHPKFSEFKGESLSQDGVDGMPLHGGCSFVRMHNSIENKIMSVQVGCDYHHLHDDHYTFMETREEAASVFHDAQVLFDYMQKFSEVPA